MQTDSTLHKLSKDELPLFPLMVVLFPGGILPLHIFEQRYRLMIQFCLDNEHPFGVVLIKENQEADQPVEPYLVGTAVKIIEVDRLADGRMNLVAVGQYRFEIVKIRRNLPYLVSQVKALRTDDTEIPQDFGMPVTEASQLYQTYESLLAQLVPDWELPETVPTLPHQLSYQIGARLQIPLTDKQRLLETFPIDRLLAREIEILGRENQKLRANLIARNRLKEQESTAPSSWKGVSLN